MAMLPFSFPGENLCHGDARMGSDMTFEARLYLGVGRHAWRSEIDQQSICRQIENDAIKRQGA